MSDNHDHDDHAGHDHAGHEGAHAGHHGSRFIQHHYDDAQHQFDAGKLGIWFFLAQEVLFFSGLFVAYIVYRHHHPEIYAYASHYLDVKWGAINTAVLIVSSLSAAWAVRCAQLSQKRGLIACLAITIVCALGFLGIKAIEYSHKIHESILWGKNFDPCIASAGNHMLNRGNACAGVKTSINWSKATSSPDAGALVGNGCLVGDYDLDRTTPGIQATCKVEEVAGVTTLEQEPIDPVFQKGSPQRKLVTRETARRAIPPCFEYHPPGHAPPAAAGAGGHGAGGAGGHAAHVDHHGGHGGGHNAAKKPCWELVRNHHVCKTGPAALVHYGDHEVRASTPKTAPGAGIEIGVSCTPAPAPVAPTDPLADVRHGAPAEGEATFRKSPKLDKHDAIMVFASGPPPEHTNMFFSIYFAMTGLHGLHVLVGVFVFIWLLVRAIKGHFTPDYFGPIDYAALYWHLVDLIWIFLFPLLYLIH